jgi:SAM-dependent methyltransferase
VDERERLRATFEEVPELYERARPAYPAAVFDDLAALAGLGPGSRVLEVGCGTGQATRTLAEHGFEVVCVELGAALAAVAGRALAAYPNVEVVHADFERWEPRGAPFDAVVAFTAWHWVDPDVRYARAAGVLRAGGALGVVATKHVSREGGDPFWVEVQADYDAVVPSEHNRPPPRPEEVADLSAEIESSGLFGPAEVRRHLWDVVYTADEYVAVLDTYSGHRTIEEDRRRLLYERIHRRIGARPSGRVTKTYLATLAVARTTAQRPQ